MQLVPVVAPAAPKSVVPEDAPAAPVVEEEFDVFADMIPEIKPPPKLEITPELADVDLFSEMAPAITAAPRYVVEPAKPAAPLPASAPAPTPAAAKNIFSFEADLPPMNLDSIESLDADLGDSGWGDSDLSELTPAEDSSLAAPPPVTEHSAATSVVETPTPTSAPAARPAEPVTPTKPGKAGRRERVKLTKATVGFDDF
jgi:hypothetical protein